jgi:hypothetical protein
MDKATHILQFGLAIGGITKMGTLKKTIMFDQKKNFLQYGLIEKNSWR